MSNTKSYRFCEQTIAYLDFLTQNTGCNERQIIEGAVQKLFTETENVTPNISIDFKDNIFGINNSQVQKFVESLPKAGYEIAYFGNYDTLVIKEIEEKTKC